MLLYKYNTPHCVVTIILSQVHKKLWQLPITKYQINYGFVISSKNSFTLYNQIKRQQIMVKHRSIKMCFKLQRSYYKPTK